MNVLTQASFQNSTKLSLMDKVMSATWLAQNNSQSARPIENWTLFLARKELFCACVSVFLKRL